MDYSARTLWLLRTVATNAGIEQIDKKLASRFEALLQPGMGDMRELLRIAGASKTVKIDTFRGARAILPSGGWASDVKLGVIGSAKADEILRSPHEWPSDIVQRAVEQAASRIASAKPISALAEGDRWFQEIG